MFRVSVWIFAFGKKKKHNWLHAKWYCAFVQNCNTSDTSTTKLSPRVAIPTQTNRPNIRIVPECIPYRMRKDYYGPNMRFRIFRIPHYRITFAACLLHTLTPSPPSPLPSILWVYAAVNKSLVSVYTSSHPTYARANANTNTRRATHTKVTYARVQTNKHTKLQIETTASISASAARVNVCLCLCVCECMARLLGKITRISCANLMGIV